MNAEAPRSAHQIIFGTVALYRRYPLLFPLLAAGVIVPYQLIVLGATGSGPFGQTFHSAGIEGFLALLDWVLISPLVSSLHVHAVREAREGKSPRLIQVAKQGLRPLPIVVAASIISGLGIFAGLAAFIVPGVILTLRWAVVAQSAAIDQEGWLPALRRSARLTDRRYGHVFVFLVYLGLIIAVPALVVGLGFGGDSTTAASFLVGLFVQIFAVSFGALATALLYFDLNTRSELSATRVQATDSPQGGHSLDPRSYSDEARPKGWYVNPNSPGEMHYWGASDPPGWSGTARTPRKVKRAWGEREGEAAGRID